MLRKPHALACSAARAQQLRLACCNLNEQSNRTIDNGNASCDSRAKRPYWDRTGRDSECEPASYTYRKIDLQTLGDVMPALERYYILPFSPRIPL